MEDKIPTAEEWLTSFGADSDDMFYKHSVEEAMIKFAKLHVEAALKAAVDNIDYYSEPYDDTNKRYVDDNSILSAYPLTNIK